MAIGSITEAPVRDDPQIRYAKGDQGDIPSGTVNRMSMLMDLADIPMLTWKFGSAYDAEDFRILRIGIYNDLLKKHEYYFFKCTVAGKLTYVKKMLAPGSSMICRVLKTEDETRVNIFPVSGGMSGVRNVTKEIRAGGYVEYDYANPRFFIGGPFANSFDHNPYDLNYYAGNLATEVYGLKVIGKNKTTWGDGIWYDIDWPTVVDYGAAENQVILKQYAKQAWYVYRFIAATDPGVPPFYTKEMVLTYYKEHFPLDPSWGEKYWKGLSDDKRYSNMKSDIESDKRQNADRLRFPYLQGTYSPLWLGELIFNWPFTAYWYYATRFDYKIYTYPYYTDPPVKSFNTFSEASAYAAGWDAIIEDAYHITYGTRWDYQIYHYSDIVEVDSYPFVEVLFNSRDILNKQVGAKSKWGIVFLYNGTFYYGGKDYINVDYSSTGTTAPVSSVLNEFFVGKNLNNITMDFYENETE